MSGSHNWILVALSISVAVAASYTALDIAQRVNEASSRGSRFAWLTAAAVCMGGGIWSMHFVAMLSYSVPNIAISYDWFLTGLSLAIAILVTGGGFELVSRQTKSGFLLWLGGLLMGIGIVAMHYIGMAAMQMPAELSYDAPWVAISVFIAIGAAVAALWLAFRGSRMLHRGAAAILMGFAISGMHFSGMRAASFDIHVHGVQNGAANFSQGALAIGVASVTLMILLAAVVAAMFDRRFAALALKEAQSLRDSEERFRQLYRATPLPLHALDETGCIEEVSDAWLSMLGFSRPDIYGRLFITLMADESARRRSEYDWPQLMHDGASKEKEYRLIASDGRTLDVLLSSRAERDTNGHVVRIVEGLVDVTDRKAAEQALRQAQKMEAIGQLTGGVAHDFNNLLTVIIGSLDRALRKFSADDNAIRLMNNALEAAQRGASLTQRLLSFARRQNLDPQAISVPLLIEGMHQLLVSSLPANVLISHHFSPKTPLVKVDPHQLEMALLNLVVNARDAMPVGGEISIIVSGELLPPRELRGGRHVCLKVVDQGSGMDEETLQKARDPFFTTKGVGKGTGLGLPMVAGFAEQSGGLMILNSELGKGTTVELWLPEATRQADDAVPNSDAVSSASSDDLHGHVILAVDDDALVLMNTEAVLQDLGADVVTTTLPLHALELVQARSDFTCVVSDFAMPKMTGAELFSQCRASRPDLPFVIATGYNETPISDESAVLLVKPFTDQGLCKAVQDAFSRRKGTGQIVHASAIGQTE